ncbi:ribosomal L7Ae/L30e/S12e/Gadd45 family protein [uncultured Oscillibacter sp.]|uniref:L7Ae/L30e/S12e/Gadd45 family ribosomal protein n=1 Tax=uncultured Oscillibacter sp. TaxID=876091 RepID=UPI00262814D3|nr:ribosomal L7Ae/L30e/S12e/Gadd45 family protein [uncultured Oscillibacter sp.]
MEPEKRVVGVKQSRKAIREGRARRVFLAGDADPALTGPIAAECAAADIPVETERTMAQLGRACGISVGASVAVELTD